MSRRSAVLLMAYGGPDSLDDVEPYLLDVRGGRPTSPEFIEEIRSRYALIGGRSPLLERTIEQAEALQRELGLPVYVGMRHWKPFISETLAKMIHDGITDVVAIAMAPQYSRMSVGAYRRKVEETLAKSGGNMQVTFVDSWHVHPLFLRAVAEKVENALNRRWTRDAGRGTPAVIFTAHSLPERILQDGDPYHDQFLASAVGVAQLLGLSDWSWAYQSQGSTTEKWLGPDVGSVLEQLRDRAVRDVLIVPVGFVCDHIEVLYDIDIFYCEYARNRGMKLQRTDSLNASPSFIRALAAVARDHLS